MQHHSHVGQFDHGGDVEAAQALRRLVKRVFHLALIDVDGLLEQLYRFGPLASAHVQVGESIANPAERCPIHELARSTAAFHLSEHTKATQSFWQSELCQSRLCATTTCVHKMPYSEVV